MTAIQVSTALAGTGSTHNIEAPTATRTPAPTAHEAQVGTSARWAMTNTVAVPTRIAAARAHHAETCSGRRRASADTA